MRSMPNTVDTANRVLETTSTAVSLAERIALLFRADPRRKAARLRGRAAKKRAKAVGKATHQATRLLADAAALEAQADALDGANT